MENPGCQVLICPLSLVENSRRGTSLLVQTRGDTSPATSVGRDSKLKLNSLNKWIINLSSYIDNKDMKEKLNYFVYFMNERDRDCGSEWALSNRFNKMCGAVVLYTQAVSLELCPVFYLLTAWHDVNVKQTHLTPPAITPTASLPPHTELDVRCRCHNGWNSLRYN